MSPFDSFHGAFDAPAGLSDHGGPILVGFPNEALIADWPHKGVSDRPGQPEGSTLELDDFANEVPLLVCSAAAKDW